MSTLHPRIPPRSRGVDERLAEVLEFRRKLSVRETATAMRISPQRVAQLQARAIDAIGGESLADAVALLAERRAA